MEAVLGKSIKIRSKYSASEYKKLMYGLTFRRPIVAAVVIISLLNIIMGFFGNDMFGDFNVSLWIGITLLILYPILVIFRVESMAKSSKTNDQSIEYVFTEEGLEVFGPSSYAKSEWKNFHRFLETDDWILLYTNKLSAYLIKKQNIEQLDYLYIYQLLKRQNIPSKLNGKYPTSN